MDIMPSKFAEHLKEESVIKSYLEDTIIRGVKPIISKKEFTKRFSTLFGRI